MAAKGVSELCRPNATTRMLTRAANGIFVLGLLVGIIGMVFYVAFWDLHEQELQQLSGRGEA